MPRRCQRPLKTQSPTLGLSCGSLGPFVNLLVGIDFCMANLFNRFRRSRATTEGDAARQSSSDAPSQEPPITADDKHEPNVAITDPEPAKSNAKNSMLEAEAEDEEDLPEDVKELPLIVRKIVSLEDDPTAPTITFRYFILTIFFVAPGAVLYQMGLYRTTASAYPVLFVQIASHYCGLWLAKILPAWEVKIPFTKWSFNLNPGPWSSKGKCNCPIFQGALY